MRKIISLFIITFLFINITAINTSIIADDVEPEEKSELVQFTLQQTRPNKK